MDRGWYMQSSARITEKDKEEFAAQNRGMMRATGENGAEESTLGRSLGGKAKKYAPETGGGKGNSGATNSGHTNRGKAEGKSKGGRKGDTRDYNYIMTILSILYIMSIYRVELMTILRYLILV